MIAHYALKDVGIIDTWSVALYSVSFHLHFIKKPNYFMQIMSIHGMLDAGEENKN